MISKKASKRLILSIAVISLITLLSVTAFASPVRNTIEVMYNNIKLVIDGKTVQFGKDSNGKEIQPFIYNGITYLPVRAVGEAIGKNVEWDNATNTVIMSEPIEASNQVQYLADVEPPYQAEWWKVYKSDDRKSFNMGGKEYNNGFVSSSDHSLLFNLDERFVEIEGVLGAVRFLHPDIGRNVEIYLDGELYKTYLIKHPDLPQKITIPVTGVKQLEIVLPFNSEFGYDNSDIGFGNVTVK
ncbi:hypothetical protein CIW83_02825 [Tissierella sp. P1]|uniref:NPCBM/NEW2 domain-containing protein n=1 Tax=Tissierella sp. P1 TaxID=1280483 RepID=UPI000B9FF44D|nr:NPCBM/NEW2 domain-containing protein [Tissierella sp. P1]OZV13496.1 hypothetical protein CIW83_02825 [Tissierella sp. P1]